MQADVPRVAWPAPGRPVFLADGQDTFDVVLVHRGLAPEATLAWARQLGLSGVGSAIRAPLELVGHSHVARARDRQRIAAYLAQAATQDVDVSTLRVRCPRDLRPEPPRTVALYDLCCDGAPVRSRAVAACADTGGRLRLAFVSDLHYARFWEEILAAVSHHGGDATVRTLDPRRLLASLVEELNRLAAEGDLDLVVLGGDLVDHVRAGSTGGDNVRGFVAAVAGLEVPTLAVPGNHDHRLVPWRPRAYGLRALGLAPAETERILRAAGMWDPWPLHWRDLRALRTTDELGRPALARHLEDVAPHTDYALTLHGLRLVFVSTGRDALVRWHATEPARRSLLARALWTTWTHPNAEGLYAPQVRAVARALGDVRGAAVFLHAPPIHGARGREVGLRLRPREMRPHALARRTVPFEQRLQRAGLRRGTCFRNPGPFLGALLSGRGPVTTFSGHVHRAAALALDRRTHRLRSVPVGPLDDPDQRVLLLTAPAAGQQGAGPRDAPGYLLASFEGGVLRALELRPLDDVASEVPLGTHASRGCT